jgi:hypothetical protein
MYRKALLEQKGTHIRMDHHDQQVCVTLSEDQCDWTTWPAMDSQSQEKSEEESESIPR